MKVFVFDLDFTIWNAGDTFCSETNPPYLWKNGKLIDQSGKLIRLYPNTIDVLKLLKKNNKIIAAASRTIRPTWALELLQIFDIEKYFDVKEIYPGSKIKHLKKIQDMGNYPLNQIIFFDDEERNIKEVSSLGIKSILVKNGINMEVVRKDLE